VTSRLSQAMRTGIVKYSSLWLQTLLLCVSLALCVLIVTAMFRYEQTQTAPEPVERPSSRLVEPVFDEPRTMWI